ncbi:MAG: hypothetical protein ABIQ07_01710 [Ginsengibacter sp.]
MKRSLLILILLIFGFRYGNCQSFTVDDLLALAHMPSKNIDHFMSKNGFVLSSSTTIDSGEMRAFFVERIKSKKTLDTKPKKSIDIYIKDGTKHFTLHTPVLNDYLEGEKSLIKSHFFYDTLKVVKNEPSMLFQKANITIKANSTMQDSIMQYSLI